MFIFRFLYCFVIAYTCISVLDLNSHEYSQLSNLIHELFFHGKCESFTTATEWKQIELLGLLCVLMSHSGGVPTKSHHSMFEFSRRIRGNLRVFSSSTWVVDSQWSTKWTQFPTTVTLAKLNVSRRLNMGGCMQRGARGEMIGNRIHLRDNKEAKQIWF